MASLNHVCMWSEHGWTRVTAEDAAAKHPGGTVSAHIGLFMCELCGQYVTLTDGDVRDRYFKHSAREANKNCPERTFGKNYFPPYNPGEHELPIKLIIVNNSLFRLELGLLYVPESLLNKQSTKVVTIKTTNGEKFTFSFERLNEGTITYLPIGNEPSQEYSLLVSNELAEYWPKKVKGISKIGAVFDANTGKMLPLDADVQVNKKYYLLTSNSYTSSYWHQFGIDIIQKCEQRISRFIWRVYELEATELNQTAAKFFLGLHCRLTDVPLEMNPIWPLQIQMPYVIKHDEKEMIMHLSGGRQITPKTFPRADVHSIRCVSGGLGLVIKVACNARQQLISAGSTNVLKYLYYWKECLNEVTSEISIEVRDGRDTLLASGEQSVLPEGGMLRVEAPFDGTVVLSDNGQIIDKINLTAKKRSTINSLRFGLTVQVLQGLDVVWCCSYIKVQQTRVNEDEKVYQKLVSFRGNEMPIQHSLGGLYIKLKDHPKTTLWIITAIKNGQASASAINYLKKYITKLPKR